jgi:enterochelin esterase-like enzyme
MTMTASSLLRRLALTLGWVAACIGCSSNGGDHTDDGQSGGGGSIATGGTGNADNGGGGSANEASGGNAGGSGGDTTTDAGSMDADAETNEPDASDPISTEGDGDFIIGPEYTADPANDFHGAPVGEQITFQMHGSESTIFPGINGDYTRNVWVYVPPGYGPETPAPFIVVQDGHYAVWFGSLVPHTPNTAQVNLPGNANLPRILDNLIAAGELPKIVAIFVENGGGDARGSERGLEYDTTSGTYAEFVQTEVLPRVISEVKSQLDLDLALTDDPNGRMTLGGSSGAAASFSMGWFHPDYFRLILSYSGTFVRQAFPEDPMFPHGCWAYHDIDPYDPAMPNGVIVQTTPNKPLRVWLEAGENDNGAGGGPETYRNFKLANDRMAASFAAKGYHYHYDYALDAGHLDGDVVAQTLPSALLWLWRGYPID